MFSTQKPLSLALYVIGVIVIFFADYVVYFVHVPGVVAGYLIVYGIPIVVISLVFGKQILGRAAKNNRLAFQQSLGLYGAFFLLGVFLAAIALQIILQLDPSAIQILQKPNPALNIPPMLAWAMMGVSLVVIGPVEEYIFRGFIFGGLLSVSKGRHWLLMAFVSALLFAAAHGYYAQTYEVASPIYFIQLTSFGVAMAIAYYWSGGNLVAPAVIHGLNDAIGFLGVATTREVGLIAQGLFIGICVIFAISYVLLKRIRINPASQSGSGQSENPQPLVP